MVTASELPINTKANAVSMANTIFGDGVTVVGASYSGDKNSSGTYSDGDNTSPGVTPGDTGVILSTGRAKDFTNSSGQSNQSTNTSTNTKGVNNDPDFNSLAGTKTYDASMLDVDFIPDSNILTMQFVFSSDEYPEYTNSIYNDAVGVWVNGNPVQLAIGSGQTNVGNVNDTNNVNLYNDNTSDAFNTEMDGFTVTMTLKMVVVPGQLNSIRIGIADVGDSNYDSNLLIAGNSVQTALIASDDTVDIGISGTKTLDVLANDTGPNGSSLTVTHINGNAVVAGDTVTLATGQQVSLNADGTFSITTDADEESVNFTYTVANGGGNGISDTAFVTVNTIPCFVAGTMILTPDGEVPVETLEPGNLVITHDDGPQPVRWIGQRRVPAKDNLAPICIKANTFGSHRELLVSPQHRILISDSLAELLFGEAEVLIAAKDLVNDYTVRSQEGGMVDYVHILFDRHQVVFSEGLATESFLPGPQTTRSFERECVEEICSIFPELNPDTGLGYSPAARRTLRAYEARVLIARSVAA
ncbi:Hint domain-containing protein [Pseudohalocynthiibacter aestuariivivens]|uniref:Hint domain-containing protein n=1 Tax=Pseudohalocynthiibacter aestuariivivens TaxID=1591409 RepID=A0ABV5JM98_9RHOB|nr:MULTISPECIES: Hint domain-containing protein [Pseudohalocynthiibacter]MBS9718281.1 choice-of-anchor L domain-containing protein [Pseudohalocynthiibacter aestuariivivens]MCK0103504.1 choice-of-anchor L domain-containing protein [Pseudohalocynthiibacter sp. F2068]